MGKASNKKENFWDLLRKLDEEAGQFNTTLSEANRYFDTMAGKSKSILKKQEKDLHSTIARLRKAIHKISSKVNPTDKSKS